MELSDTDRITLEALIKERGQLATATRTMEDRVTDMQRMVDDARRIAEETRLQWWQCNDRMITFLMTHPEGEGTPSP